MNDVILIQHIRYTYITYYIHIYPSIHLATLLWNIVSSSWGRTAAVASENGSRRTGELSTVLGASWSVFPQVSMSKSWNFWSPQRMNLWRWCWREILKNQIGSLGTDGKDHERSVPPQNEVTFATKKGLHDFANWSFWTFPDGAHQSEVGQKKLELYTFTKINTCIINPQRNAIP